MAGPESRFRSEVRLLLKTAKVPSVPVENCFTTPGLPDLCVPAGWAELKIISKWPTKPTTPLRIPHYTDEQRRWSRWWTEGGGRYWLLVKVAREWFIFDSMQGQLVGNLTKQEMIDKASHYWKSRPSAEELGKAFT